ncbi:hypothetical protein [Nocardioides gilvus]|uniref:hypothetical protein n=1 Tax=Nocardioides gilvus TaxID=1735589 RepID=UPI000D74885F|nr:hypothetical protein [Nocardioides gilvus]
MARGGEARRRGARKAARPAQPEWGSTPIDRGPVLDERKRPVPVKRSKDVAKGMRVDPTRVSGPIRFVLEPMLWVGFLSGVLWVLILMDPGVRTPSEDGYLFQYAIPLGSLVSAILLISTISALMHLPHSTTATRARTSFAGLGMLASGWLFAKLHPVDTEDLLGLSWLSIGIGVLLVAICSVPWPTTPAGLTRSPRGLEKVLLVLLFVVCAGLAYRAWEAAQLGLVGVSPGAETGWDQLMPILGVLVILLGIARYVLRRPAGNTSSSTDAA